MSTQHWLPGQLRELSRSECLGRIASGWSVLRRGRVEPVDTDDLPPAAARPHPWAAGQRSLRLRLVPRTTTGRRLLPG